MKNVTMILLFAMYLNNSNQKKQYKDQKIDIKNIGLTLESNAVTEKSFNYKKDYDDHVEDPGNPDTYAIIKRPCPIYDRFCIRNFFAQHSDCKIVQGPVKEPFFITEFQLYPVVANITITVADILITGLNGRIEEFYVNKVTDNLVLSILFEGTKYVAKEADFRFYRNGEEPVEVSALAAFDFVKVAITIVIPNFENLKLENAEVNGYLEEPLPPFFLVPNTLNISDPTVIADVGAILTNIPTTAIESLGTIAPFFASIFIQKNICDFGVPINRI